VKEEVIGRRYAKALILLGKEKGNWEGIGKDLETFVSLFDGNELLRRVLCDPVHDRKKQKRILQEILKRLGTDPICSQFLCLLVEKERIRYLPAIHKIYRQLEDNLAGRLRAKVITARKLGEEQIDAIKKSLEGRFHKKILLEETEDTQILGGIICKVDGMVFDGSVRTQLEILKENIRGE
jgi:F-type H+-transporting ATPase subunit delta